MIVSNMMSSCPEYGKYAEEVLAKQMDPKVLAEIEKIEAAKDFSNPRYMELLLPNFYEKHILRFPVKNWPEPEKWDRKADLKNITIPTLVIGAQYDTMDPKHMEAMAKLTPKGTYLYCDKGSHMAMYDDQKTYFKGLIDFLKK